MMGNLTAYAQRASSYPRTLYVTFNRAPVYDSANYMSAIIRYLPAGDSVQALGASGKFFRITLGERAGYVLAANLSAVRLPVKRAKDGRAARSGMADTAAKAATSAAAKKPEGNARAEKGAARTKQRAVADSSRARTLDAPAVDAERRRPARAVQAQGDRVGAARDSSAASAQRRCRAITKAGTQCSRMTSDSSGYCWQHRK